MLFLVLLLLPLDAVNEPIIKINNFEEISYRLYPSLPANDNYYCSYNKILDTFHVYSKIGTEEQRFAGSVKLLLAVEAAYCSKTMLMRECLALRDNEPITNPWKYSSMDHANDVSRYENSHEVWCVDFSEERNYWACCLDKKSKKFKQNQCVVLDMGNNNYSIWRHIEYKHGDAQEHFNNLEQRIMCPQSETIN